MEYRNTIDQRNSNDVSKRDIPSFIEPMPPLISNPFMRPRPQKGTNLLELFDEDSESNEPELVQVYLRLKPCSVPNNLYEIQNDNALITSVDTATVGHGRRTQHNVKKMYTFSHIFGPQANQKQIFEHVVKGNLRKLSEGHNFTLLTYGASGSGKTYTLMGTVASPGLVPRSLEYVFRVVDAAQQPLYKPVDGTTEKLSYSDQEHELQWVKKLRHVSAPLRDKYRRMSAQLRNDFTGSTFDLSNRTRHYVWVSFVEIYNEAVYDLLVTTDRRAASKLRIREDTTGNVYVKGARQAFVRTGEEAYDVMVAGKHNLQVAATGVHAQSSRSHCIFTITMLTETEGSVRVSCVRLCDLAGCERARRTRNTGQRMQESRAINTSLHVLERCLHVLRRRRRAPLDASLVPYRESKLTRLLGGGLSGGRFGGEAVSMVVTLNPAPEYAHESRHVLQLADVARDIQVNNTVAESIFESSSQDTTIGSSAEVMRLRADNERLHFELIQSQARIKELTALMEKRQQEAASMMSEVVKEAKEMTRRYYEAQIEAIEKRHCSDMEDLIEEYENKSRMPSLGAGTPLKLLQNKVTQLVTENAILEEELTAERSARARAEEEVQNLRACIRERNEQAFDDNKSNREDVMMLNDSDEDTDDPCNESLEPTFKKADINRSRMLIQSLLNESQHSSHEHEVTADEEENTNTDEESVNTDKDSVMEVSGDTIQDHDGTCDQMSKNSTYLKSDSNVSEKMENHHYESSSNDQLRESVHPKKISDLRGTYCVTDIDLSDASNNLNNVSPKEVNLKPNTTYRGTYCITTTDVSEHSKNKTPENVKAIGDINLNTKNTDDAVTDIKAHDTSEMFSTKHTKSSKLTIGIDSSLAQFEQLEIATKASDNEHKQEVTDEFANIKIIKEKRKFFEDDNGKQSTEEFSDLKMFKEKRTYFDNIVVNMDTDSAKKMLEVVKETDYHDMRSPSIIKDDISHDYEPNTVKKLFRETLKNTDVIPSVNEIKLISKKHDSIDIFEGFDSPQVIAKAKEEISTIKKTVGNLVMDVKRQMTNPDNQQTKSESPNVDENPSKEEPPVISNNETCLIESQISNTNNNTTEDFENIYKDITEPNATDFELLVSQEISEMNINDKEVNKAEIIEDDIKVAQNKDENEVKESVSKTCKYKLRKKIDTESTDTETSDTKDIDKKKTDDVTTENVTKENTCKSTRKNLRLRLRKKQNKEEKEEEIKLKDIVNLQKEFSDVTLDVPASKKDVKDIPSPEEVKEEVENFPPLTGAKSCPIKSARSNRRKLFTPRAEPLEESLSQTGDSNERVCVPRPSYHRIRARRKL